MLVVSKMSVLTVYIEKNMVDSFIAFVCYNDKKKLCIFASTDVTMGINIFAMTTMNKKIAHLKYLNRFKKKKKKQYEFLEMTFIYDNQPTSNFSMEIGSLSFDTGERQI